MSNVIQFRRSTAILTLVAASIGGGLIAAFAVASHSNEPMYVMAKADTSSQRLEGLSNSFADVIEKASPAVVNIQSTRVVNASEQQGENPFTSDPFFRQFFGGRGGQQQQRPHSERERGLGSGVIINGSGYILTNNHVVDKATTVKVTLLDKREFTAKVIGADPQTDVAIVKIDASGLPALPLGNSDSSRVGDLCFAIGNPFGYDHTVTMGIVSAKGRSLENGLHIQNFIQTDAAINPGNSGGALINARGELIGMNTAIITGGGGGFGGEAGNIGIGFAVPVNLAKQVMDQIIKTGKVSRGYMGVSLQELTPDLAQSFGLKDTHGAVIADVTAGGPGDKGGLKSGDIVTAIDGNKIANQNELTLAVTEHAPGSTVTLDVVRNGQPTKVNVTLGQRPSSLELGQKRNSNDGGAGDDSDNSGNASARGITAEPLTPEIAQQIHANPNVHGVVVDDVDQGSATADSGIGQGDVITGVNGKPVNSVSDFKRLMGEAQGKAVRVTVNRGGQTLFLVVPAGK
jgi:Do/DeqQ family serine protease